MTMHTRYRAAQQVALGEVLLDLVAIVAPADEPSEVGTQALVRLESKRFTLTALPVDDQARATIPDDNEPKPASTYRSLTPSSRSVLLWQPTTPKGPA